MTDLTLFQSTDESGATVEAVRPETKSNADVIQCINHHHGSNDIEVDKFIKKHLLGLQWDWYELYKEYLIKCEKVNQWNEDRVEDEEGNLPEPRPLPVEPVRPEQTTASVWRLSNYQLLREAAYNGYQQQFDMMYKNDSVDTAEWTAFVSTIRTQYPAPAA